MYYVIKAFIIDLHVNRIRSISKKAPPKGTLLWLTAAWIASFISTLELTRPCRSQECVRTGNLSKSIKFKTGRNSPASTKNSNMRCARYVEITHFTNVVKQMWPVALFLVQYNNLRPDYGLLLELHALTQVARSYALLMSVASRNRKFYCLWAALAHVNITLMTS